MYIPLEVLNLVCSEIAFQRLVYIKYAHVSRKKLESVQYYVSLIITDSYKAEKMNLTQICYISEGSASGKSMF